MNDFTKEELEHLYQMASDACGDYNEPDLTYKVRDKIQSLIENYCEHEWTFLRYIDDDGGYSVCFKCKKRRGVEND